MRPELHYDFIRVAFHLINILGDVRPACPAPAATCQLAPAALPLVGNCGDGHRDMLQCDRSGHTAAGNSGAVVATGQPSGDGL